MSVKLASALAAASALVALELLTNSTGPSRATCSMRWARPAKVPKSLGDGRGVEPLGARQRIGGCGVLPIMGAAERADAVKAQAPALHAVLHLGQNPVLRPDAGLDRMADGNPLDGEGPGKRIGDGAAIGVIDADDGGTVRQADQQTRGP